MRDVERIDEVLSVLSEYWHAHPDLRLAQIILNLQPANKDIFYIEDSELLTLLKTAQWIDNFDLERGKEP